MNDLLNETDSEFIQRIDGWYVATLSDDELRWLDDCVKAGIARRSYEGAGGMMGLAKVRRCVGKP